jgi:hypothetical protein
VDLTPGLRCFSCSHRYTDGTETAKYLIRVNDRTVVTAQTAPEARNATSELVRAGTLVVDGTIVLGLAAVGLVCVLLRWRILTGLVRLASLGVAAYDGWDFGAKVGDPEATFDGVQIALVGWGLYAVALGGFVVLLAAAVRPFPTLKRAQGE